MVKPTVLMTMGLKTLGPMMMGLTAGEGRA